MSDITSADIGNRRSLVGSRASASKRNGALRDGYIQLCADADGEVLFEQPSKGSSLDCGGHSVGGP